MRLTIQTQIDQYLRFSVGSYILCFIHDADANDNRWSWWKLLLRPHKILILALYMEIFVSYIAYSIASRKKVKMKKSLESFKYKTGKISVRKPLKFSLNIPIISRSFLFCANSDLLFCHGDNVGIWNMLEYVRKPLCKVQYKSINTLPFD